MPIPTSAARRLARRNAERALAKRGIDVAKLRAGVAASEIRAPNLARAFVQHFGAAIRSHIGMEDAWPRPRTR